MSFSHFALKIRLFTPFFDKNTNRLTKMCFTCKKLEKFYKNKRFWFTNSCLISFCFLKGVRRMQNYLLKPLISKIKEQDMSVFFQIFEEFKRLISFYGNKLGYEDAVSELTLFFIELLYDVNLEKFPSDDGEELNKYIAVSIKNRYIALSMEREKSSKLESVLLEECCGITHKYDDSVCVSRGVSRLNDAQKFVFFYHFVYGFSIVEIADQLNISRQAVNKTKNQVISILRKEFLR